MLPPAHLLLVVEKLQMSYSDMFFCYLLPVGKGFQIAEKTLIMDSAMYLKLS